MQRYWAEGVDGLRDHSSRPHYQPRQLTAEAEILALRAKTAAGPQRRGARPASTVDKARRRRGGSWAALRR